MRLYDLAMYFALFGMVIGAMQTVMLTAGGNDWFHGAEDNIADTIDPEANAVGSKMANASTSDGVIKPDGSLMSDVGNAQKTLGAMNVLWDMCHAVLTVPTMISNLFFVPVETTNEDTGVTSTVNGFAPFALVLKCGLYMIYAIGFLQIYLKFQIKYAE